MTDSIVYEEMKKLKGQGIFPLDHVAFGALPFPAIGVRVESVLPAESDAKPLGWTVEIVNKRGAAVYLSDWQIFTRDDQKILSFVAYMRLPDKAPVASPPVPIAPIATSFQDFCWYHGNEAIEPTHEPEATTKVANFANYGDIGWLLPCRFADRLVDALGKANEWLLSGILEDAILYGVLLKGGK